MSFLPPPLPDIIRKEEKQDDLHEDDKLENMKAPEEEEKIVVILHTKDIDTDDLNLLKKHGSVRNYNYSMFNLDLAKKINCKYLLCDVRDKLNKLHIQKLNKYDYKWVAYVHSFQKHDNIFDDFIKDINVLSKFPHDYKVAFKFDFDRVLTEAKQIKTSGCLISLLSFLLNGASSLLKK